MIKPHYRFRFGGVGLFESHVLWYMMDYGGRWKPIAWFFMGHRTDRWP